MNKKQIAKILEKYKAGHASKKEKALLLSLSMNFRPANAEELSIEGRVLDVDLICAELAKKLLQAKQVRQEKPVRFWSPLLTVAVVTAILSMGTITYVSRLQESGGGFGSEESVPAADVGIATALKNERLMFEGENIRVIMEKVSRCYHVGVVYEGEVPNDKFGVTISRFSSLSQVLRKLELSGKVHFKIQQSRIIVTK